jgi:hypothetical protein
LGALKLEILSTLPKIPLITTEHKIGLRMRRGLKTCKVCGHVHDQYNCEKCAENTYLLRHIRQIHRIGEFGARASTEPVEESRSEEVPRLDRARIPSPVPAVDG